MKSKSLILLLAALVIGVIAYYLNENSNQQTIDANSNLIPELAENLNNITKFTVVEAGNTTLSEVSKSDKGWIVNNRDGYEANIAAVRQLLTNLAEAKLVEAKTSNSENYVKLGVEDVSSEKAQGVLFSIEGLKDSAKIIFGKDGSSGKNTQYVRRHDEAQSWLINKKPNLKRDVTDWLQKDLLDIPPERIKDVHIKHPDGGEVSIANNGKDEYEYTLDADVPDGMNLSESEIYQLANALSSLQLRDVVAVSKIDTKSIEPIETTFKTFDGLTITSNAYTMELDTYFTIEVGFSSDEIDQSVINNESQVESTSDAALRSDPIAAEELAAKSKDRLDGWAYIFPSITQNAMTKKLEDFFVAKEAE